MTMTALYARVSTELQEQESRLSRAELAAIRHYAEDHGYHTMAALTYIDEGFSGSRLDRPALDELRDHAREADGFRPSWCSAPDRLARKYAYQVLLIEEVARVGVPVHFCERPITDSPDDQLLLQIQGAIAEYERAKILERCRRGRLYRARLGGLATVILRMATAMRQSAMAGTGVSASMKKKRRRSVRSSRGTPKTG